jgi:hypothetical protein
VKRTAFYRIWCVSRTLQLLFVVDYVRVWQSPSEREKATTTNGATEAAAINASSSAPPARQSRGRTTAINVV